MQVNDGGLSHSNFYSPSTLNAEERYHVVGTFTTTEGELWINGQSVVGPTAHDKGTAWMNHPDYALYSGAFAAGGSTWLPTGDSYQTGTAIYQTKLTPQQIRTHFRAGREGF